MNQNETHRRQFLTGIGATAAATSASIARAATESNAEPSVNRSRLPREVCIATVSQAGAEADSPAAMVRLMLGRMESAATMEPDLVCLPEVFPAVNLTVDGGRATYQAVADDPSLLDPIRQFASRRRCYVVAGTYTRSGSQYYNAAVLIDRTGNDVGEYHKSCLTPGEVDLRLTPGPVQPTVFDTDFGKLGCQICFDIEWPGGWEALRKAGAEIVVWPSAFAGGRMVNTRAYSNRYVVVSSTRKNTSKICDVDGSQLAATSHWQHWAAATVNLEKLFLHTWPVVRRFDAIYKKYGADVRITTHAEEEWSILESRSPDVKVADIAAEFDLMQIDAMLDDAANRVATCRAEA